MNTVIDLGQFTVSSVIRIFGVGAAAFFLNIILTNIWLKVLSKYFKSGKEVEKDNAPVFMALHKKKEGTPTMGGLPVWVTLVVLILSCWAISQFAASPFWSHLNFLSRAQTFLPLGFLVIAGLIGLVDDIFGVSRRKGFTLSQHLIFYTIVAIIGAWWFAFKLGWDYLNFPFLGQVYVGWWYIPFFIILINATSFSIKITDGLDGLVGGVFLTMFGAYAAIAFDQGKMDLTVFLVALMGALVAFLWFNIYPARFFMGETGTMALGATLGVVAAVTDTPFLLPLIAIIPFMEALSVIIQTLSKKIRHKKVFFSTPIHHHFEALGWPETQITMRFWMINALGAVIGLIIFLVDSKVKNLL
jgi:phospho-N-acetylmuramoyl-pentapeptide-transferase